MIEQRHLFNDLREIGLDDWCDVLAETLDDRMADDAHGDLATWRAAIGSLPSQQDVSLDLQADSPGGDAPSLSSAQRTAIRKQLQALCPWRKGPFNLCGIEIDAEWRSNLKWQRIEKNMSPLRDRAVLDVGSGNGYYALRMQGAGARLVIGVDPTLLFVCQFLAIQKLLRLSCIHVLPLRLHELPLPARRFDSTFSMGVLYHQRRPHEHLTQLHATLRPGGELILETLVIPGDEINVIEPEDRYARMRNVWHLPTTVALEKWLLDAGFSNIRIVDVSVTTPEEQRATDWMRFESLADSLDPQNPALTIEGLPRPLRAIAICSNS